MKFLGSIICGAVALCAVPLLTLAAQEASVMVRPGVASAPLDAYFDLADALGTGINQSVKVTISAHNTQKTAVKFKDVYLIDKSGTMVGVNAAKSDALQKDIPTTFIFQNFGASPTKLANVVGVRITFLSMGGDDPTDIVKVSGVQASVIRDIGESCVSIDPNILEAKEKPVLTIDQIVNQNRSRSPIAGDGGGGGGGGGSSTSLGPNSGTTSSNNGGGAIMWSNHANVLANDGVNAVATTGGGGQTANLDVVGFGFSSIPITATINGVVVEVDRGVSPGAGAQDVTAYLINGGSTISSNNPDPGAWLSSFSVATYGTATNASTYWGAVTATHVANATFGFRISALISTPNMAMIDHIQITVYYTPAGGSVYDAFTDLIRSFSKRAYCIVTFSC